MALHYFDKDIAIEYGVESAIILNNLYFWIEKNKANNTSYHDGNYWTYNSTRAFSELFPYMSEKKIRRALKILEDNELILTGNYNKIAYDRTTWYAITEKGFKLLESTHSPSGANASAQNGECILPNGQIDLPEKENGSTQKGEPIPYINTDNKPNINKNNIYKQKHKYGEYKNVLLSDEEMEKLQNEFPTDWSNRIERLSEYIEMTGKSYKSHLATIRNWARREKNDNTRKDPGTVRQDRKTEKTETDYGDSHGLKMA